MQQIKIIKWTEKVFNGKETVNKDFDTIEILNMFLMNIPPAEMPKGLANFTLMSNIAKAFNIFREQNTDYLFLENSEYNFFKNLIEKYIPANFGTSLKLVEAINYFFNPTEINFNES